MLRVRFARIRPEKVERLKNRLAELVRRKDEVRATFRQEGIRHEQAFLLEDRDGPLLVYVMEAEDPERASAAFRASQLPIDLEHARVLAEVQSTKLPIEPLYDCAP
jgi:hypothetical protein